MDRHPVPAAAAATVGVFDIAADGSGAGAGGMRTDPGAAHAVPLLLRWDGEQSTDVPTGVADGLAEGVGPDGSGGAVPVGYDSTFEPMLLRYRDGEVTAETSPVTGDVVRLMDAALTSNGDGLWVTGDHKTPEFVKGVGVRTASGRARGDAGTGAASATGR